MGDEQEPAYDDDDQQLQNYDEDLVTYLPFLTKQDVPEAERIIESLRETLSTRRLHKDTLDVYKTTSVPLDHAELTKVATDFPELVLNKPELALGCLSLALAKVLATDKDKKVDESFPKITVRLYNFEPRIALRQLKSHMIGKFVSIRGTVIRVSNIKPLVTQMAFDCKCGAHFYRRLVDGKFNLPTKCEGRQCRAKIFEPDKRTADTVDWQKIRIQEEVDHKDSGRVPRSIEAELTGDLVDTCVPGDVITICGIVKVANIEAEKGNPKNAQNKSLFQIYIDVNSVDNNKVESGGKAENMDFTVKELYMIQDIAATKNIFRLIVNSVCPSIYGHEVVKAGLTLALFGGTQKHAGERNKLPIRNESHVLVVGDPGLGKSQMLMAINNISPRGVYVCGSHSTTTGLTVKLMKETGSGDYSLEAGALVLGDRGCCCIDEFDKMPAEHQALLEAMEQQSVSIAKAGIVCNLPARTSVIAAANPAGGHYDRSKTVSENLKMGPALLSRFDVIFILLDRPDEERDKLLSEHVISLHGRGVKSEPTDDTFNTSWTSSGDVGGGLGGYLKARPGDCDPIPPVMLRKYISYARKYCHPKVSAEACDVLREFYLKLRRENKTPEGTPITTRQLESLIRLAEARAKLELQEVATANHARDVVAIMKESIFETLEDEKGNIDFRRAGGMSKRNVLRQFESILAREAKRQSNAEFSKQQMRALFEKSPLSGENFNDILDALSTHDIILKSRNGWKLANSDF
eukprot:Phypoly_transcript_03865.p1 GENE.Phypoly_transcript_03865~~Phypoly_transcript_03865.p1  ORF type:complete len:758 (+),score=108.96 Phypoly_transcript_03865:32-2275(+)